MSICLYGYLTAFIIIHITFDFFAYISHYTDSHINIIIQTLYDNTETLN